MTTLVCIFLASSCGGSGPGPDAVDVADEATDVAAEDAGEVPGPDAEEEPTEDAAGEEDEDGGGCTESLGPMEAYEEECYFISEGWDYLATVEGTIESVPYSYIVIELWPTMGGPSTPGTYSFEDVNYDECGLCSVVRIDCYEDCAPIYLLTSGTIEVDEVGAIGGSFSGRIVSATGIEVTLDLDLHSTPVEGGGTLCVEGLSFSTTVLEF